MDRDRLYPRETPRERDDGAVHRLLLDHSHHARANLQLARAAANIPGARVYHAVSTGYAGLLGALLERRRKRPFILSEQFGWLEHVLAAYERWMTLPIESPRFHELADVAWNYLRARELEPNGVLDTETQTVTLRATSDLGIEVTGVAGGTLHGGQSIRALRVSPAGTRVAVERATDR